MQTPSRAILTPNLGLQRSNDDMLSKRKPQRNVRFGPTIIISNSTAWNGSQLSPWLTRDDFNAIMSKAIYTAVEARKHFLLSEGLEKTMVHARSEATCLNDQGGLHEYLENMEDNEPGLRLWCQYGHSRRGLERYTCQLFYDREIKEALFTQVAFLSKTGAQPDLIRRVSERISRPYVIVARKFGIADARAAMSQLPCSGFHERGVKTTNTKTSQRADVAVPTAQRTA
jgi:hypothetical protein